MRSKGQPEGSVLNDDETASGERIKEEFMAEETELTLYAGIVKMSRQRKAIDREVDRGYIIFTFSKVSLR